MVLEADITVRDVRASAYRIPTDEPESDGTLAWDSTTLVLVEAAAGGMSGIGYTYSAAAAARLIADKLASVVVGGNVLDVPRLSHEMNAAVRNLGQSGIAAAAIAAVDGALWDLKAKLVGLPLALLLGRVHEAVPVYGSGGFTSYDDDTLREQLGGWAARGIGKVKMKIGRWPDEDIARVEAAREAVGPDVELFVDANGAYDRKQALARAGRLADCGVSWFEEPVSSEDLEGLRLLRDRAPPGMAISAGEYGYRLADFRRLIEAGAVDVLQADASRCGGISGFMAVGALCRTFQVPLSTHTCPALHLHAACATEPVRHMEWFHDHVRIESMLFDGAVQPEQGMLRPDLSRPGLGIEFRHADAERFAV